MGRQPTTNVLQRPRHQPNGRVMKRIVAVAVPTTLVVAACTLGARAAGFVRELLMAQLYGAVWTVDALLVALTPSWVVILVVGEAFRFATVPSLARAETTGGLRAFWARARRILWVTTVIGLTGSLTTGATASLWVPAIARGMPEPARHLAIHLAWLLAPVILCALLGNVLAAIANARGRVARTAAVDLAFNLVSVPVMVSLAPLIGIYAAAAGWLVGYLTNALLLWAPLAFRQLPSKERRREVATLSGAAPIMVAVATTPLMMLVDRAVATKIGEGSVAALNYGFKLFFLPLGVLGGALATVSYPRLARAYAAGARKQAANILATDVAFFLAAAIPIAAYFVCCSDQIVAVLFRRGAFDARAQQQTSACVVAYSFGIVTCGYVLLHLRAALAASMARLAMQIALVGTAINIALDFVLPFAGLGVAGIAWAATLASLVAAAGYGVARRAEHGIPALRFLFPIVVSTAAGVVALIAVRLNTRTDLAGLLLSLLVFGAITVFGYAVGGLARILKSMHLQAQTS